MLSEEQLNYIKDNEDYCWNWFQNKLGYLLVFPVIKHGIDGPYSFATTITYQQHELTRDEIREYFKDKVFDNDISSLLDEK